jgi:hypothetical protein
MRSSDDDTDLIATLVGLFTGKSVTSSAFDIKVDAWFN